MPVRPALPRLVLTVALLAASPPAQADQSPSYILLPGADAAVSAGGVSAGFQLQGTLDSVAAEPLTSPSFQLRPGEDLPVSLRAADTPTAPAVPSPPTQASPPAGRGAPPAQRTPTRTPRQDAPARSASVASSISPERHAAGQTTGIGTRTGAMHAPSGAEALSRAASVARPTRAEPGSPLLAQLSGIAAGAGWLAVLVMLVLIAIDRAAEGTGAWVMKTLSRRIRRPGGRATRHRRGFRRA